MLIRWCIFTLLLAALAGCQNKRETQKEAMTRKWNQQRAGVMHSLARDQYRTGDFDKSRKTLDQAMVLDPENVALFVLSAKLAIEQAHLERGERDLLMARELDPQNAEPEYLLGVIYQRWQKLDLALECYTRASEKSPAELAYLLARSEMLVTLDRNAEALALLQEKVVYFEHSAAIRDAVGQLLMQEGRYREACDVLRQASVLATDDSTIREHFAMSLLHTGNHAESAVVLKRLLDDPAYTRRGDLWTALGECQIQSNQSRESRSSFELATQLQPASVTAWLGLCKAAMACNDLRRADLAIRKAFAIDPADAQVHLLMGYVRLRQGKHPEALAAFRKASALDPEDGTSLCMIGLVLEQTGRGEQAMRYYAQALRLDPRDRLAMSLMASVDVTE